MTHATQVTHPTLVERLVNLMDPARNIVLNMSLEEATCESARGTSSKFGKSTDSMRWFTSRGKSSAWLVPSGDPCVFSWPNKRLAPLIVAERIDEIRDYLDQEGLLDQFHPSYTRSRYGSLCE